LGLKFLSKHEKPTSVIRRRALVFLFDLSGRLDQAMAVRRHGCPMVMVVAVMAEALHLFSRYGQSPFGVKWFVNHDAENLERRILAHACARSITKTVCVYRRARDERVSRCALPRLDGTV
jgi:hypothetical protein